MVMGTEGPIVEHSSDRASFRWILCYDITTDTTICRLDIKVDEKQVGKTFHIAEVPKHSHRIAPDDPLITPRPPGVIEAHAMLVDRATLAKVLQELAQALL